MRMKAPEKNCSVIILRMTIVQCLLWTGMIAMHWTIRTIRSFPPMLGPRPNETCGDETENKPWAGDEVMLIYSTMSQMMKMDQHRGGSVVQQSVLQRETCLMKR
uniref:Uncharacterized protein n=1 Tax=Cacopsylla melanoneura TaxID=428564 RepID=A0A8D9F0S2_9HEMI